MDYDDTSLQIILKKLVGSRDAITKKITQVYAVSQDGAYSQMLKKYDDCLKTVNILIRVITHTLDNKNV